MNNVKNMIVSIPNIHSDIYMVFIVRDRDRMPITPMEYFVQTSEPYALQTKFFMTQMD